MRSIDPKTDRAMARLESLADIWAEEIRLVDTIKNVTGPMKLNRDAPESVRDNFRHRMESQIDALMRQAFIEGAYRGFCGAQDLALARKQDTQP